MRFKIEKYKKIGALMLATIITSSTVVASLPIEVIASRGTSGTNAGESSVPSSGGGTYRPSGGSSSGSSSSGNKGNSNSGNWVGTTKARGTSQTVRCRRDEDCEFTIWIPDPYETNFRTMQVLDVATVVNEHTESATDYRPIISNKIETFPEFKMADIVETRGLEEKELVTPRENVPTIDGTVKQHAKKLEDLITHNIISRDTEYLISKKGVVVSPRVARGDKDTRDPIDNYLYKKADWSHGTGVADLMRNQGRFVQKYERPKSLMSRTDFITELTKTEKIESSAPILARSKYSRVDNRNVQQFVEVEEVEKSPYQEYMGDLGLDTGQTDVMISHKLFGKIEHIETNNVSELYLRKAYNKGMIKDNELVNDKNSRFSEFYLKFMLQGQPNVYNDKAPRYTLTHEPMRFFYNDSYPSGKEWEEDNLEEDQYPEKLAKWKEIIKEELNNPQAYYSDSPIWGETFDYLYAEESGTTPSKDKWIDRVPGGKNRKWKVTDDWTITTPMRVVRKRTKLEDPVNGYGFFKQENLTVMDAYKYAYQHLLYAEGEKTLSKAETDFINAVYSLDMTSMTAEEQNVIKYLIAKGVIDGDNTELYKVINQPLTNEVGIDIIWKVFKPEERIKINPQLSELDLAMLAKGYKKAKVNTSEGNGSDLDEAWIDSSQDRTDAIMNGNSVIEDFKGENMSTYDYIFIRTPKIDMADSNLSLKMVVNDNYRTEIPGYLLGDQGGNAYVDKRGNSWTLYIVHKDLSTNLMMLGSSNNNVFTYTGINGEGFYFAEDKQTTGELAKWTISDFYNNKSVKSFFGPESTSNPQGAQLRQLIDSYLYMKNDNVAIAVNKTDEVALKDIIKFNKEYKTDNNLIKSVSSNIKLMTATGRDGKKMREIAKIVSNSNKSINETIWEKPLYLGKNDEQLKDILYGPLSADKMEKTMFRGDYLFEKTGAEYKINEQHPSLTTKEKQLVKEGKFKVEKGDMIIKDNGKEQTIPAWTIRYPSPTQSYKRELAKFMVDLKVGTGGKTNTLPGYAKVDGDVDGEPEVMISKSELADMGVTVISDKLLENNLTRQRALLDTDDNITQIGNNITQYKVGEMIVNAFGADKKDHTVETGDADRVFYNLNVVMELLNDRNLVKKRMGSTMDLKIAKETLTRVPVKDVESVMPGTQANPVIDYTYVIDKVDGADGKNFLNLSALAGPTSNFIYYKNRAMKNPTNVLVVYKPKPGYVPYSGEINNTLERQWGKPAAEQILTAPYKGDKIPFTIIGDKYKPSDSELAVAKAKKDLIETLFKGVNNGEDFLRGNYIYNVYILAKDKESIDASSNSFMAMLAGDNKDAWTTMKQYMSVKPGTKVENGKGEVELTINTIVTGTSPKQDTVFLEHQGSGNLYMYMADTKIKGKTADLATKYSEVFRQNMYLEVDAKTNKKNIRYRQKRFYENTPDNLIPLETYANHKGSYGSMFYPGGRQVVNFGTPKTDGKIDYKWDYKLPNAGEGITARNKRGNNFAIIDKERVGLFTNLELPFIEITLDKPMKGRDIYDDTNFKKDVDINFLEANKSTSQIDETPILVKDLLAVTMKRFDDAIAKKNTPKDNTPIGVDDGDIEQTASYKYSTYQLLKKARVGFDHKKPDIMASLMNGTWDPILQQSTNNTQFSMSQTGHKLPKGMTEKPTPEKPVIVLVMGNNPSAVTDNLSTGKIEPNKVYAIELTKPETLTARDVVDRAKLVKSAKDLKNMANAGGKKRKIYMKPSIGIPQGSTLVTRNGGLLMRPNESVREEVLFASNIINSIIFRVQLAVNKKGIMFLHEVPQGAIVNMSPADGSRMVMKGTVPQEKDATKLQWVKVYSTADGQSYKKYTKDRMNNFQIMTDFLEEWGNPITIPYDGTDGMRIPLKSIVGKSVAKVATASDLNTIATSRKKDKGKIMNKYYGSSLLWTRREGKKLETGKKANTEVRQVYEVELTETQSGLGNFNSMPFKKTKISTTNVATPVMEIALPPTILVEPTKKPGKDVEVDHDYDVVGYFDIKGYAVDPDNSYVEYLREKDTNAYDVLDSLEVVKRSDLMGRQYAKREKTERFIEAINSLIIIISKTIAFMLYFAVVMILILWILLQLPLFQMMLMTLSEKFGLQKQVTSLTRVYHSQQQKMERMKVPAVFSLFAVCIGMIFIAMILDNLLIADLITKGLLSITEIMNKG